MASDKRECNPSIALNTDIAAIIFWLLTALVMVLVPPHLTSLKEKNEEVLDRTSPNDAPPVIAISSVNSPPGKVFKTDMKGTSQIDLGTDDVNVKESISRDVNISSTEEGAEIDLNVENVKKVTTSEEERKGKNDEESVVDLVSRDDLPEIC